MPELLKNPSGYDIAAMIGDEAYYDMHGDNGEVLFLESGRVLKITGNHRDAAIAIALMNLQAKGSIHPSVPSVFDVRQFQTECDLSELNLGTGIVPVQKFAIIRSSMDDLDLPDDVFPDWLAAISYLNRGWRDDHPDMIKQARKIWQHGPELEQVIGGLQWIKDATGVTILDIRAANIGAAFGGPAGMRDLGNARVPESILRLAAGAAELEPRIPAACLS